MTADARQALIDAVNGDLAAVSVLETLNRVDADALAGELNLVLSAEVVARVIAEYDAGVAPQRDVQRWAELMRWGHLPGPSGPVLSNLDVDYEYVAEDAIADAIGRLDELGDIVDGELRPGEAAQLRAALVGAASRSS